MNSKELAEIFRAVVRKEQKQTTEQLDDISSKLEHLIVQLKEAPYYVSPLRHSEGKRK